MVEAITDTCQSASVRLHDVLHGFFAGRGIGTAILELKLAQDLDIIDQDPPFLVFLDLQNAYDTVYWGRLLTNLE